MSLTNKCIIIKIKIPDYIKNQIKKDDRKIFFKKSTSFTIPAYNPKKHYLDLTNSNYYHALIILRHYVKMVSCYYFESVVGAKNVDLFMLTPSISSPTGSGSDSEAIPIKLGKLKTFLADSSQFGLEPLLLNDFERVYCYLPSMRGENYDARHLNQFFHCEMEMKGELNKLIPVIENYIKILCEGFLLMDNIVNKISSDSKKVKQALKKICRAKSFPQITLNEAIDILKTQKKKGLYIIEKNGMDITFKGNVELMRIIAADTPIWLTSFDRCRTPFYQKPDPKNQNKVINADLLFPPLVKGAFGGEIVGSGQRQDNSSEMYESLKRQNVSSVNYEWYIKLRKQKKYKITSGFGLGIERFIAWLLAKENIRDVALYPRLKNITTYP